MLKKETIQRIATLLKLKPEELSAAIEATDEKDIAISEKLIAFTEDEVTTLKNNEYKKGKNDGVEIEVKRVKEEKGLDFQGKTLDGLADALTKKALDNAKIEPNKQIEELNTKVANLQNTVKEKERLLSEKETEVSRVKINNELFKNIPPVEGLEPDDIIAMMERKGYDFKLENGKVVPYKDGNPIIDQLSNAKTAKDVAAEFIKEKGLFVKNDGSSDGSPSGRGTGDGKTTNGYTRLSDLKKKFESEGKSLLGEEFANAVREAQVQNKDFDLNS